MMRHLVVSICTLAVAAVPAARAFSADALTDKMAIFSHLVGGTWTCSVRVPALSGHPAETIYYSATYDVAPRNILHSHISWRDIAADQYYGYNTNSRSYWQAALDTEGVYGWATWPNGTAYSGYAWDHNLTSVKGGVFDSYANLNANRLNGRFISPRGNQVAVTSVCTRPAEASGATEPTPKN
jgi:hypothetical protein